MWRATSGRSPYQHPENDLGVPYHGLMTVRGQIGTDEQSGPPRAARPLRADAARNRSAILAAARAVFAERGLEAPLEDIALRAGVGIATLYRRFPDREQLVAAALEEKVGQYAQAAAEALATDDPWAGFANYVERICEFQADDQIGRAHV